MNLPSAAAAVVTDDLDYHVTAGGPLGATLYRPTGDGPFPAVVSVHGGRWCTETRLTNQVLDQALAAAGIVVMAIDFRQPPAARYPLPVGDINLAIRWLKQHAASYRIAAGALGGIGTSSGAHQLLLNALRPDDPRYRAEKLPGGAGIDASLAYAVACWPVCDPLARYRYALERAMEIHVQSHHAYWPDEAAMADGSPQRLVEQGAATHLPPLLVVQGAADVILPPQTAQRFAAAYHAAGGTLELAEFGGEGHTFITKDPTRPAAQTAIRRIRDFILARAAPPPASTAA